MKCGRLFGPVTKTLDQKGVRVGIERTLITKRTAIRTSQRRRGRLGTKSRVASQSHASDSTVPGEHRGESHATSAATGRRGRSASEAGLFGDAPHPCGAAPRGVHAGRRRSAKRSGVNSPAYEEHPVTKTPDQWGPRGTNDTRQNADGLSIYKGWKAAPGVTAALRWRDRCFGSDAAAPLGAVWRQEIGGPPGVRRLNCGDQCRLLHGCSNGSKCVIARDPEGESKSRH